MLLYSLYDYGEGWFLEDQILELQAVHPSNIENWANTVLKSICSHNKDNEARAGENMEAE